MSIELIIVYGIISICLGLLPALLIISNRFGFQKQLWFSWILGGIFWLLALLFRMPLLYLIQLNLREFNLVVLLSALLAGLFETLFRVVLILGFTKYVADSKEKLMMAGLGWGMIEAVILHSIPVLMIMITPTREQLELLEGYEWTLLFGGFERIMVEIFHLVMMTIVFYGLKKKLKDISQSEPIADTFFTKDPNPVWLWIVIVMLLHFSFDFILVSLVYSVGVVLTYMLGFVFVGLLASYLTNRIKAYPLFPKEDKLKR